MAYNSIIIGNYPTIINLDFKRGNRADHIILEQKSNKIWNCLYFCILFRIFLSLLCRMSSALCRKISIGPLFYEMKAHLTIVPICLLHMKVNYILLRVMIENCKYLGFETKNEIDTLVLQKMTFH